MKEYFLICFLTCDFTIFIVNPIVTNMMLNSVAETTRKAYDSVKAKSLWTNFLQSDKSGDFVSADNMFLFLVDERNKQEALCLFINHLDKDLGKSRNSIGSVMAALRFLFLCNLEDIAFFESKGVKQIRKSLIERGRCNAEMPVKNSTMFITLEMILWLRDQLFSTDEPINMKEFMIVLSILLGFHFGYRIGEISISNGNNSHTIQCRDVIFETFDGDFINAIDAKHHRITSIFLCIVILRSRKADQHGGGDPYFICRYTDASIQLLEDMFWWAQVSSNNPYEIFFYRPNPDRKNLGYHLRAKEIIDMIRISAVHFGLDPKRFAGKSMRNFAATLWVSLMN